MLLGNHSSYILRLSLFLATRFHKFKRKRFARRARKRERKAKISRTRKIKRKRKSRCSLKLKDEESEKLRDTNIKLKEQHEDAKKLAQQKRGTRGRYLLLINK